MIFNWLSIIVPQISVRQKQVTVGLPPHNEVIITGRVIKSKDILFIIHEAYRGDELLTMVTQEILVYLSMFVQTEPELFHG